MSNFAKGIATKFGGKKKEKKEKKIPKTTQWTGVSKQLATTFHSKSSLKDIPKEFEDSVEKVKFSNSGLAELLKAFQKLLKIQQGLTQANSGLSRQIFEYSEKSKTSLMQEYLNDVYGLLGNVNSLLGESITQGNTRFVEPINDLLASEIAQAKASHKQWKTSRIELDVTRGRYDSVVKGNWDPIKLFVQLCQLNDAKLNEFRWYSQTCDETGDAIWRRDIVLVNSIIHYLYTLDDQFKNTYNEFVNRDSMLSELDTKLKETEESLQLKHEERMNQKMQDATFTFEHRYDSLIEILSAEDLALVNAIAVSSGSEQEDILRTVINILDAHKKTMPIIRLTIEKEVAETTDASTLFRGNTCATKLMSQFTRMTGREYLESTVVSLLEELLEDPNGYEVDPDKIKEGDVETNMAKLISMTERFLDAILNRRDICPEPFKLIASHLVKEILKKFPESKYTAVGGFIFLRFFCPAVMSPDSQGIIETVIDPNVRRPLILISKSLQNLSNGIEFGKKEPFMEPMNEFIHKNRKRVEDFFDFLAEPIDPNFDYEPVCGLSEALNYCIPELHRKIVQNLEKIAKTLILYQQDSILPDICRVLGELGAVDVEIVEEPSLKKMKKKKT